ncbi:MAG: 16S rRNA (cytosine(1402)-N(4))-methyltransferase RsmH [Rickettsiaceae bacterium]|nr:16S rRNA (cytosine(1402)-N(4))-methyltransferase RsmH [Rickettsiaceae bacterium]MDP4832875.1 16S rRNA (cytosine(1402)-N(4))-methyltransferase RsmH [Rickettsiaceae bacterium]MDP5021069.1 16S rRNA (cytosine(1402)-N(4))-methyltransferase RsmH [Rickettsiaceae bacterium]MDP5082803.1 16S rRNA (cytosine(1402)-N(4))-methyltransferase RsmH [Rickettsiaceae bacterium]
MTINDDNIQDLQVAPHMPVLLTEVLEYLILEDGKKYLDCTFGAGGYTKAILSSVNCSVVALDQDPTVSVYVDAIKQEFGQRFEFVQTNFAEAKSKLGNRKFDGIVLDLGVSSMQIDSAKRGFSFMKDGPLDMRMGNADSTAAEFIANATEEEIANVIYKYGEEVQSRQIAKKIVETRLVQPITTTLQLAEIVREAMHFRKAKIDPATKTFQAIRIHINKELESLEKLLNEMEELLEPGGRILVVSFHSLEDSIVKYYFKEHSPKKVARSKYAKELEVFNKEEWLQMITKKAVTPTQEEVQSNPRARSSRLRVAAKIGGSNVA